MPTTAYPGDTAAKFMCTRNIIFSSTGTNFMSKIGGTNATADSWALLRKMLLVSGPDQRVRGLVKNVTKGMLFGWSQEPGPNFDLCIKVVKTSSAINIFEGGVQKGGSYGTANEDSEFSIRMFETSGVLGAVYLWRPHAGDPETTMYTSLLTDSALRHLFPSTFKCVLMDNDGATQPDNSAIETVTMEGDSAHVADCVDEGFFTRSNFQVDLVTRMGNIDSEAPDDVWAIPVNKTVNATGLVLTLPAVKTAKVKQWDLITTAAVTGSVSFKVQVNGFDVTGPLTLTNVISLATTLDLYNITVGDRIDLICTGASGVVTGPIYLRLTMR